MPEIKPTLEEFRSSLRLDQNNPRAEHIVLNFWNNWEEINDAINTGNIKIVLTEIFFQNYLKIHHPHYALFKKLRFIGIILFFSGIAAWLLALHFYRLPMEVFFLVGLVLMLVGMLIIIPYHVVKVLRSSFGFYRLRLIKKSIRKDNWVHGMTLLCNHYISRYVILYSSVMYVSWPEYPGRVLQ